MKSPCFIKSSESIDPDLNRTHTLKIYDEAWHEVKEQAKRGDVVQSLTS